MGSILSCALGSSYFAPERVSRVVATSKGAFFKQPKIFPFSVSIRLEYLPIISAYKTFSTESLKSFRVLKTIFTIRSNPTKDTLSISAPARCLRISIQNVGATLGVGFSLLINETRQYSAFAERTSVLAPVFV